MLIIPPGVLVIVQIPVAGKPFKVTLPVSSFNSGWVMIPIVGAPGVGG